MLVLEVSVNGVRRCSAAIPQGGVTAWVDVEDLRMPDGRLLPPRLRIFGIEDFVNLT
jgi:hypothetical protein